MPKIARTAKIAEVLGGSKTLRTNPSTGRQWHEVIRAGMPMAAVEALKKAVALPDAELAELLGVSLKTLSRARRAGTRLDPVISDRVFRLSRLIALASEVLEHRAAALSWLKRPQAGLGGKVPLQLLTTEAGAALVEQLLLRMEHGVYA